MMAGGNFAENPQWAENLASNLIKMIKLPNNHPRRTYMLNLRHAFKFAPSTIGATAFLLSFGRSVMAHAPLTLPLTPLHVHSVNPTHAELENLLHRSSNAAAHLLPIHLVHPINPIHTELENSLLRSSSAAVHLPSTHLVSAPIIGVTSMSHASGIPFDLSFRNYPEVQHEKLASIVVLLVHSERLDASGDFKRRDQINDQARTLLYSLGKQTVLKVARDAQFLQLHVLKHIFQIAP
jgi:hypothetical protein